MKILLVDQTLTGHHISYLESVSSIAECEFVYVLPKEYNKPNVHIIKPNFKSGRSFKEYMKYMGRIYQIACKEKVDIVHFLYGDYFYKFFGLGLGKIKKHFNIVMTFHVVRLNKIKTFSLKRICKKINDAVVHTEFICELFRKNGINNCKHIEYPNFMPDSKLTCSQAKEKFGLDVSIPVIAALGGTRYDKGLDLLLEALNRVKTPFQVLIAGREQDIKQAQIDDLSAAYRERVKCILDFISEEEFSNCVKAADIIALPYRKMLNGASGPLGEGVYCGKLILGTDYGSVGELIKKHHIGYLWDSDSIDSMVEILEKGLNALPFEYDSTALAYQDIMKGIIFKDSYLKLYEKLEQKEK